MDKYDLLEAMGEIRDRYIEEAALPFTAAPEQTSAEPASTSQVTGTNHQIKAAAAGRKRKKLLLWSTSVAALLCVSIILLSLVTLRRQPSLQMAADSRSTDSGVFTMGSENPEIMPPEEDSAYEEEVGSANEGEDVFDDSESIFMSPGDYEEPAAENQKNTSRQDSGSSETDAAGQSMPMMGNPESSNTADKSASYNEETLSLQAVLSEADLSEDTRDKVQAKILAFEKYVSDETGYESLCFMHEIAAETDDLLSISVTSCTEEDDNYLQTNHFVFDKSTGNSLPLRSLFGKDVDYITPLSENIKEQMRKEMEEDSYVQYSLDSSENPETDFKSIRPDQDYYINEDGNLVICFDIEEVAPLYMGAAEFIIPQEITDTLLSK